MKVKSAASVDASFGLSVSVGIQGAVSGVHFSANAPVPVSVSPDIVPSTGSIASAVVGTSFGIMRYSLSVQAGLSVFLVSKWVSDSFVSCKSGAGVANSLSLIVSSSLAKGSITGAVSYATPHLSSISPGVAPVSGSTTISVTGFNVGIRGNSASFRVHSSACENSLWVSESHLLCRIFRGNAANHPVSVCLRGHAIVAHPQYHSSAFIPHACNSRRSIQFE